MSTSDEELIRCTDYLERFNRLRSIPEWISEVEFALDELLDLEYSGLYLYNSEKSRLELLAAKGFTEAERLKAEHTAMDRHPGKVFRTGEVWYIPDVLNDPTYTTTDSDRSFEVRSRLYYPIRVEGNVVGVFGAVSSKVDAFSPTERESFRFLIQLSATVYLRIRTEEKNAELNRVHERLSFIATHTDNMVVLTDRDQRIEWVNTAFEQLSGYQLQEVYGRRPGDFLQRDDVDQEAKYRMNRAIENFEPCVERVVNYNKQGSPYFVEIQIYPIFDTNGLVTHFISLQRDITAVSKAREELEASRNQLSAVISALPDQLLLVEGQRHSGGVALQPLTSVRQEMLAFIEETGIAEDVFNTGIQPRSSVFGNGEEIVLQCPRTACYFEARFSLVDDSKGILLIRDISARKALEAERDARLIDLEQALAEVKSRNDRLHNFSNVLSHNIRSHTSNIMALVKLIQLRSLPFDTVRFFEVLSESAHYLDETIRSLNSTISLSIDAKVAKEEVVIREVLRKTMSALAVDIADSTAQVTCNCEGAPLIWADKVLLESVLMNLITNAIKYRDLERNLTIDLETTVSDGWFKLIVRDNGSGIDLNRHGHEVFGMFKTFDKRLKGQGIGLYLTRNQVEMMGGKITVQSTPGVGSTFTILLPRHA